MPETATNQSSNNKIWAALSYVWILFLLPLFFRRGSGYVQFHARQGMVLFIFEIIISILAVIPLLGWFVNIFGWLAAFIFSLLGIWAALKGSYWEMPFLGKYAKKWRP